MRSQIEIDAAVDALAVDLGLKLRSNGTPDDNRDALFYSEAFKLFESADERAAAMFRANVLLSWFNGTGPLPAGYDR